jgi:deoxyribose-phosphate aldolase
MYTREQFAKMIDQSLVRPDAVKSDVLKLAADAAERHFACVVVFPCWVGTVARALEDTDVKVSTVISYPFGGDTRAAKTFAIRNAISNGANELDAVFNISKFKSGDSDGVKRDLSEMAEAVKNSTGSLSSKSRRVLLKVIIETCYLSDTEIETAAKMVRDAGADFVQTSTGTGPAGAKYEHIRLIRRAVGPDSLGIKASGGIRTTEDAINLLDAGANRIGTSAGVALYDSYDPEQSES